MIDNDRIKFLVERTVSTFVASNGGAKTGADERFVEDMTELAVGLLQSFNEIGYQLEQVVDRMDRMRT
jgi:hypothetical protein